MYLNMTTTKWLDNPIKWEGGIEPIFYVVYVVSARLVIL